MTCSIICLLIFCAFEVAFAARFANKRATKLQQDLIDFQVTCLRRFTDAVSKFKDDANAIEGAAIKKRIKHEEIDKCWGLYFEDMEYKPYYDDYYEYHARAVKTKSIKLAETCSNVRIATFENKTKLLLPEYKACIEKRTQEAKAARAAAWKQHNYKAKFEEVNQLNIPSNLQVFENFP